MKTLKFSIIVGFLICISWLVAAFLAPIGLGFGVVFIPPITNILIEIYLFDKLKKEYPSKFFTKGLLVNVYSILAFTALMMLYFILGNISKIIKFSENSFDFIP